MKTRLLSPVFSTLVLAGTLGAAQADGHRCQAQCVAIATSRIAYLGEVESEGGSTYFTRRSTYKALEAQCADLAAEAGFSPGRLVDSVVGREYSLIEGPRGDRRYEDHDIHWGATITDPNRPSNRLSRFQVIEIPSRRGRDYGHPDRVYESYFNVQYWPSSVTTACRSDASIPSDQTPEYLGGLPILE